MATRDTPRLLQRTLGLLADSVNDHNLRHRPSPWRLFYQVIYTYPPFGLRFLSGEGLTVGPMVQLVLDTILPSAIGGWTVCC